MSHNEPLNKSSRFVESFPEEMSRFSPDTPNALHAEHDLVLVHPSPPSPAPDKTQTPSFPPAAVPVTVPVPASDQGRYPLSRSSFGSSTYRDAFSPPQKMRDLEEGYTEPGTSRTFTDRLSRWFFDARSGARKETSQSRFDLPIQELPPWSPLNAKKHHLSPSQASQCCVHCREHLKRQAAKKQKRPRRRFLVVVLVILLLWLMGNVVALNIVNLRPSSTTTSSASTPDSDGLTTDQQACLSQFTLNAPSTPTLYPCAQCLSIVEQIPSNSSSFGMAFNAAQFCGLRSLWEDADSAGQTALQASGWVKDVRFCAWGGVQCNGSGQVSSIELTAPAIPAGIPSQLSSSSLPGLETFQIIGNNTIPSGPLPSSFATFNLATLHLESTGFEGTIPGTLTTLTSLTLVRNPNLSGSLPDGIAQGTLQSLIINNEPLSLSQAQQAAFCSGTSLRTCDLRGTDTTSCGSCTVG